MSARATTRRGLPKAGILALLAVAEFMLTLDLSIVNVALPAIRGDLGFSESSLRWVVNGYALTFAGLLLLGGRAADLFGGRRVFIAALSAFSVASLACGLATTAETLIVARVGQGMSAGVLAPATLYLLTTTYRDGEPRNRALSIWTAVAIGGGAVGAALGGALTGALSWRWIFFINVPVGAVLAAFANSRLPRGDTRPVRRRLDVSGAIAVTAGLTALVWALIRSDEAGWRSGEVIGALVASAVLLGAFVLIEGRLAHAPLMPFPIFRSRLLWAGNLLSFLSFVPVMATWFFLTLYLQSVRGHTPATTGLLFLPISLAVVGGSQLGFRAISRVDARFLMGAGGLVAAAGLAWLGRLTAGTGTVPVILAASIAMAGGGLMFAPITVAATSGLPPERGGLASGLLNTTRQIGGALGLAVLGAIAYAGAAGHTGAGRAVALSEGYATAFRIGAAVFLATAIIGAFVMPARPMPARSVPARPAPATAGHGASRTDADAPERAREHGHARR